MGNFNFRDFRLDKLQKYAESIIIIILWILIFFQPLFFFRFEDEINWDRVVNVWSRTLPFFILFLINHFLLIPYLLLKNKKGWFFVSVMFLAFVLTMYSNYRASEQRMEKFDGGKEFRDRTTMPDNRMDVPREPPQNRETPQMRKAPPNGSMPAEPIFEPGPLGGPIRFPIIINTMILSLLVIGFDTGLRVSIKWFQSEKEKSILEKEKVKNELAFLRNQVSPHFFMNTLNNIHALIDINTEQAKDAVVRLSKLMRHLIYDSESDKISLRKEIEFIQSYVGLMKLRFTDKVKIKVEFPVAIPQKEVPPLLFISLLENAFIHGVSYKSASFINISLVVKDDTLVFNIQNSKHKENIKSKPSGIGVENTRKRLRLLYGNNCRMAISETKDIFEVDLTIPI